MPAIISDTTREVTIADEPVVLINGRWYSVQVVTYHNGDERLDVDVTGRLDLERPGSDRLFFVTEGGFIDVPAAAIVDIREVRR